MHCVLSRRPESTRPDAIKPQAAFLPPSAARRAGAARLRACFSSLAAQHPAPRQRAPPTQRLGRRLVCALSFSLCVSVPLIPTIPPHRPRHRLHDSAKPLAVLLLHFFHRIFGTPTSRDLTLRRCRDNLAQLEDASRHLPASASISRCTPPTHADAPAPRSGTAPRSAKCQVSISATGIDLHTRARRTVSMHHVVAPTWKK